MRLTRYYWNRSARSPLSFHEQSNGLVCAWSSILLLRFLKKWAPLPPARKKRPCARNSCVLPLPRKDDLCVSLPPPPSPLPTSTHNLLYSRSACMADGSSLLRLLPVVARMVLARHKRVFRAHPTQYAKMLYIM